MNKLNINNIVEAGFKMVIVLLLSGMAFLFTGAMTMFITDSQGAEKREQAEAWKGTNARWKVEAMRLALELCEPSRNTRVPYAPLLDWENLDGNQVHNAYLAVVLSKWGKVENLAAHQVHCGRLAKGEKTDIIFVDMGSGYKKAKDGTWIRID